jgi:hypothetical protein
MGCPASLPCYKDVISSTLAGIQGDQQVTAKRMAKSKDRYKMKVGMAAFS